MLPRRLPNTNRINSQIKSLFPVTVPEIIVTLLIALGSVLSSPAAEPTSAGRSANRNAALDYWQGIECLIAHLPDDGTPHDVHFAYLTRLANGHVTPLDDQTSEDLKKAGVGLYFLHRGNRVAYCDWGLAFDDLGPADEQGHIVQVPYLAGAAYLRARLYLAQGRDNDATNDLLAVLQLAKQIGQDGRDGTKALLYQLTTEQRVIEIAASCLPRLNSELAEQIRQHLTTVPVEEVFKNLIAVQQSLWVGWPKRFAESARTHEGNWDVYWETVALRSPWRTEVGDLLRKAASGIPDHLTKLADEADEAFREATRLADLPPDEFRRQWRTVLKKTADRNLILSLAGGELEPIQTVLLVAATRRDLFRTGVAVGRSGPQILEGVHLPCGPLQFRKLDHGFELETTRKIGNKTQKLTFESTSAKPEATR